MGALNFLHLHRAMDWLRCDHQDTALEQDWVRLATAEGGRQARASQAVFQSWLAARGGAVLLACAPDLGEGLSTPERQPPNRGGVLLADPDGSLLRAGEAGYRSLELTVSRPETPSGTHFGPASRASSVAPASGAAALTLDPLGRLWLLERGGRVRLLRGDDPSPAATLAAPAGTELIHLAAGAQGVLAAGGRDLWWQPYGGEWLRILWRNAPSPVRGLNDYLPVTLVAGPGERFLALYRHQPDGVEPAIYPLEAPRRLLELPDLAAPPPALLAVLEGDRARILAVPDLEDPLYLLVLPDGDLLVGEVSGPPGGRMHFTRFTLTRTGLSASRRWLARRFDGRALVLDQTGWPWATTERGLRRLYPIRDSLRTEGRLETPALDAGAYGVQWHRIFLDVCVPPGTAVRVQARSAEELYPETLRPDPRPPEGNAYRWPDAAGREKPVLGSRSPQDQEGWLGLAVLDRRPAQVDIALPPRGELPALDPYPRGETAPARPDFVTLEGLLPVPPGRYLWLRVDLKGSQRQSPMLLALRATLPRPSLLSYLPAFWRADPESARLMDQFLSLFEGELTGLVQRIEILRHLVDPRISPPEVLSWLAGFVGLSFDTRLGEGVRRQLIQEAMALYRSRGTRPGLERLCAILSGSPAAIVEDFRLRPPPGNLLGAAVQAGLPAAVLGTNLSLPAGADLQPRERALVEAWREVLACRDRQRAEYAAAGSRIAERPIAGGADCCEEERPGPRPLCPPEDPAYPLDRDPLIGFYRRYAHRFTVILYACRDRDLEAVVDQAMEDWKPAHTLHSLCWLEPGLRVGVNAYVGVGTRLAEGADPTPAVLGQQALDRGATLSRVRFTPGTAVGAARVGRDTYTS